MVELGELENSHEEFTKRRVRIVAVSNDDEPTARETKKDFPHLTVVADREQKLARSVEVIHPAAGHDGGDTNAPTMFLVDGNGTVRWFGRPSSFIERFSPAAVLTAIDANLPGR